MQKRVEGIIGTWAALTLRVALLDCSQHIGCGYYDLHELGEEVEAATVCHRDIDAERWRIQNARATFEKWSKKLENEIQFIGGY